MKREIDPKAVSTRLIQRMKELDISGADITRATGATSAAITKWRQGINAPTRYVLQLAKLLQTTPEWLLYGTPSTKQELPTQVAESLNRVSNIGEIGRFRLWSRNDPLPKDEYAHLPFYKETEFKGGAGSFEIADYNDFILPFAKSTMHSFNVDLESAFCCTLTGDSMAPIIPNGASIGVNPAKKALIDGEIYAFRHDELLRVKRLYRVPGNMVRINSFNPEYKDEVVPLQDIEIIGHVFTWSVIRRFGEAI